MIAETSAPHRENSVRTPEKPRSTPEKPKPPESIEKLAQNREQAVNQLADETIAGSENIFQRGLNGMGANEDDAQEGQALLAPLNKEISQVAAQAQKDIETVRKESQTGPNEQFRTILDKEKEENDLEKKLALRQERANLIKGMLGPIDTENEQASIEAFNAQVANVDSDLLAGLDMTMLQKSQETIFFLKDGKLEKATLTSENAKEFLSTVKSADNGGGNSYDLRREVIERSGGKIATTDAYTYGDVESLRGGAYYGFINNPENWQPERRLYHQELMQDQFDKAHALSERINADEPQLVCMRGNTGSGKSTALKSSFPAAFDAHGELTGAINPDPIKADIIKKDSGPEGGPNHWSTHAEGAMIAFKARDQIIAENSTAIVDQRLAYHSDIEALDKLAKGSEKKMKIIDIDGPIDLSAVRVLGRPPGGSDDWSIPFEVIADGFKDIRRNRAALIEEVKNNPNITEYSLFALNENGVSVKVGEKKDGIFTIVEGQGDLYKEAVIEPPEDSVIENIKNQVIDDAYIQRISTQYPLREFQIKALSMYKGKTLAQALLAHGDKLKPE